MARTVGDIMTKDPITIEMSQPVVEAARRMRTGDVGDVLVCDDGKLVGIVTDRDIAVRLVAEERDANTPVSEIVSQDEVVSVSGDTSLDQAVQVMRTKAIRRLPVVEKGGHPVGVVSLGDLALEKGPESALSDISAARGNV